MCATCHKRYMMECEIDDDDENGVHGFWVIVFDIMHLAYWRLVCF